MKKKILAALIAGITGANIAIAQPKQSRQVISTETVKLSEFEDYCDSTGPEFREALEDIVESEPEKAATYCIKAGAIHTAIDIYRKNNYSGLDKYYSKNSPFSDSREPKFLFFKIIKEGENSGEYRKALYFCDKLREFYSTASEYLKESDNHKSKIYNAISKDFADEKERIKERRIEKAARRRVK